MDEEQEQQSKRVFDLSRGKRDRSVALKAFLEAHRGVNVNLYMDEETGLAALGAAVEQGHVASARLLIDANADLQAGTFQPGAPASLACMNGNLECLQVLIDSKADIHASDANGCTAVSAAALKGSAPCLALLLESKASASPRTCMGYPIQHACREDQLACVQLLVDGKADVNVSDQWGSTPVHAAMRLPHLHTGVHRVPGMPFALLSCKTDSNVSTSFNEVSQPTATAHINEYKQIHAFIDDCHSVAEHTLSEDVVVDTRVGRGDYGLYHEPLEQVLLYLGLSMKKNQTVNASIDGKSVTRALIPGHPTNANLWYELYQRTHCSSCAQPGDRKQQSKEQKSQKPETHKQDIAIGDHLALLLMIMLAVIANLLMS
jgi:hypothetical protein